MNIFKPTAHSLTSHISHSRLTMVGHGLAEHEHKIYLITEYKCLLENSTVRDVSVTSFSSHAKHRIRVGRELSGNADDLQQQHSITPVGRPKH